VLKLVNGTGEYAVMSSLLEGDRVLALVENKLEYTEVLSAILLQNQTVDFVTLSFEETREQLRVTGDHGVLVSKNGKLKLYQAKSVEVGDKMNGLGFEETVKKIEWSQGSSRVALKTAGGAVIASGTAVLTICGEFYEEGSDFEETYAKWAQKHVR
jgi:hypothetical protein